MCGGPAISATYFCGSLATRSELARASGSLDRSYLPSLVAIWEIKVLRSSGEADYGADALARELANLPGLGGRQAVADAVTRALVLARNRSAGSGGAFEMGGLRFEPIHTQRPLGLGKGLESYAVHGPGGTTAVRDTGSEFWGTSDFLPWSRDTDPRHMRRAEALRPLLAALLQMQGQ